MKIIVKKDEEKVTITNESGKILSVWYKKIIGDVDVTERIKKLFPNAEIVEN